jgi:sigma-E factor negative regulatory protein RseC
MEQIGIIIKEIGNNRVELEVKRPSGCGSCKSCASSCEVKPHYLTLKNNIDAKPGDFVELKAIKKNIMKYITIIYTIPFMFLIAGIVVGNVVFKNMKTLNYELLSFGMGMFFLAISFFVVRIIDNKFAKKDESVIVMTRKL